MTTGEDDFGGPGDPVINGAVAPAGGAFVHAAVRAIAAVRASQPTTTPAARKWKRCRDLVDMILARAAEPWTDLRLGSSTIASVRAGGIPLLIGGTGRGKTSLAASLLVAHAQHHGPAVAMSLELPDDEWTARAIGTQRDASWPDVLRGRVSADDMRTALPERLTIIDRSDASIDELRRAIADLKLEYPSQPFLVAIDYVQLMPSAESEIRRRVAVAMAMIDALARDTRVVVLALSQGSRGSTRELASGDRLGAETTDTGAEASELERWATLTLAIGKLGPEADDGTCAVDLSIGKSRMGGGDRVIPARYCGRSGLWRIVGDARPAADVRAERTSERDAEKCSAAELAIAAAAERAIEPMTRDDLAAKASTKATIARAAITNLIDRGELVEVRSKKPRAKAWKVWTRARADAAGIPIVTGSEGSQ